MKKCLSLLLAALMLAAVLTGCGGNPSTEETDAPADTGTEQAAQTNWNVSSVTGTGTELKFRTGGDQGTYYGFGSVLAQAITTNGNGTKVTAVVSNGSQDNIEQMQMNVAQLGFVQSDVMSYAYNGERLFEGFPYADFSTVAALYMEQVQIVTCDPDIKSVADLEGKIVEVQTDSSAEAALKEDPDLTNTFSNLQITPDYNTAFMDLEMGAVDAIAMDVIVAGYQMEQRDNGDDFVILDETLASEEYGIGFKKGNEALRDQVQATLEEMAADGTMAEISEKWFGRDVTTIGK